MANWLPLSLKKILVYYKNNKNVQEPNVA